MYIDAKLEFSSAQALTTTAVGTNVKDLATARSIGNGEPMSMVFVVTVAADQTTGDEDYTFQVEYASNAAQSTGRQLIGERNFESGTPTAPAQNADLLVAGFTFAIPIPATNASEDGQFLGIRYVLAGTSPSITCDAFLVPSCDVALYNPYPNNYTVTS